VDRLATFDPVDVEGEEGGVALDLDELETARRVDDLVEHALRRGLRVTERAAMELHVVGVTTDVGDEHHHATSRHPAKLPAVRGDQLRGAGATSSTLMPSGSTSWRLGLPSSSTTPGCSMPISVRWSAQSCSVSPSGTANAT